MKIAELYESQFDYQLELVKNIYLSGGDLEKELFKSKYKLLAYGQLDLAGGRNIMARKDGTPVIIDPYG